jgi:hypothetical protein
MPNLRVTPHTGNSVTRTRESVNGINNVAMAIPTGRFSHRLVEVSDQDWFVEPAGRKSKRMMEAVDGFDQKFLDYGSVWCVAVITHRNRVM